MKTEYFDDGSGMSRRRQASRSINGDNANDGKSDFFMLELTFWIIVASVTFGFFTMSVIVASLFYVLAFIVFAEIAMFVGSVLFVKRKIS